MAQEILPAELSQESLVLISRYPLPSGKCIVKCQEIGVPFIIVSSADIMLNELLLAYFKARFCSVCFLLLSEWREKWRLRVQCRSNC